MSADASALVQLLRDRSLQWCDDLADEFVRTAQSRVSRRTGTLHDSIENEGAIEAGDFYVAHVVVGEEYGIYQDEGSGVFAPSGTRIQGRPFLAFDWPAAGGLVIVRSVSGSPGTHFWSEAVNEWPLIVRRAA